MDQSQPTVPTLADRTLVAFDTETTGLWAPSNRIVEIAAVRFRLGQPPGDTFQRFINPGMSIPEEVIKIHGITDAMVAEAGSAADVLPEFFAFCGAEAILIAHNAPFDLSFLWYECKRHTLPLSDLPVLDSRLLAKRFIPGLKSYGLLPLAKHLKLAESQEHRALSDSLLVTGLLNKLTINLSSFPIDSLDKLSPVLTLTGFTDKPTVPEQFTEIQEAIESGGSLVDMVYRKSDGQMGPRTVRPLLIHGVSGQLYLNAYCYSVQAERTFRLDRIESYTLRTEDPS